MPLEASSMKSSTPAPCACFCYLRKPRFVIRRDRTGTFQNQTWLPINLSLVLSDQLHCSFQAHNSCRAIKQLHQESLLTFTEPSRPLHHKPETWPSLCLVWLLPQPAAALFAATSLLYSASSTTHSTKSPEHRDTLDVPLLLALM